MEVYCFHVVRPSVTFWFLFLSLLNNLRNLFVFCKNVDTDKMQLLHKNKGLGVNFFRVISLCNSLNSFWFLLLILLRTFRNHFVFCINIDTDEVLQLDINKSLNSFSVISLCNC